MGSIPYLFEGETTAVSSPPEITYPLLCAVWTRELYIQEVRSSKFAESITHVRQGNEPPGKECLFKSTRISLSQHSNPEL